MALIANGRVFEGQTYMFVNKAYPNRALNVWCSSSYPATNQSNVCLWTKDTADTAQHWVIDRIGTTNYILKPVANSAKALDLYTGTGTGANSNAQLYTPSETSYLEFDVGGYSDTVHIKLAGTTNNGYFLTAYSDANGTRTGKSNTSAGNVFFQRYEIFDDRKEWIPVPIGTTSGGDTADTGSGNGTLVVGSRPSTLNYNSDCYGRKFDEGQCTWHAFGRAIEVTGKTITFSATSGLHAKTWWNYVTNCVKSSTPRANSIAVWDDGGTYGHVAYVEAVLDDGTVYYTEANWKGTLDVLDSEDGKVREKSTSAMATRTTTKGVVYNLLGYLYL